MGTLLRQGLRMRVIVNGLAALTPRTGVGHHVAHLTAALAAEFPADTIAVYPGGHLAALLRRGRPAGAGSPGESGRLKPLAKRAAKWMAGRHFSHEARRFDLVHEPNFVPFLTRRPTVVTVHDLSVVRHPDWHPADRVAMHARHFRRAVDGAARVIVVSDAVRAELLDYAGLPPERVVTIYNGTDPSFCPLPAAVVAEVLARLGLPGRFFLCVGTIEPRKNLLTVLRAFAALPLAARTACPLVLAGPWGWRADAERAWVAEHGAAAGVRHLGYVAAADLPAVTNAAAALVYPSHYEGFGLPPVEMLATGGRVLASTAAAVVEVCGPFAHYTPATDTDGWTAALFAASTAGPPADAVARMAHAGKFTWTHAARETMAVYRAALNR